LKVLELYKLKQIPRDSSNQYVDEKDGISYMRRETTAEHVYSSLRLADFFLLTEPEFSDLDKIAVFELLMYHDDLEIITRDVGISNRNQRIEKEKQERKAIPVLSRLLPARMDSKLERLVDEFRLQHSSEAKFAHAIDKMDALVHELQYPADWGPKGYNEQKVREWFSPAFVYSPTFMSYFERMISHLNSHHFFDP